MRLRVLVLPALVASALAAVLGGADEILRDPKYATITNACTPNRAPDVNPPTIHMTKADHIEWRAASPQVTSWTIRPVDPAHWPFAEPSFSGGGERAAVTPTPLADAAEGVPYAYLVEVTCADGTSDDIDPDIIIGGNE